MDFEPESAAHRFSQCLLCMKAWLSQNEIECINDAIQTYGVLTHYHSYDEELQDVLIPFARVLDDEGYNSTLPEFDILKGVTYPDGRFDGKFGRF